MLLLPLLHGCRGLDAVEIVAGEHCADDREVEVACTLDGDTFQVGACGGESVRLLGINAPEIAHDGTEVDECWGPESAAWLTDRLDGLDLLLEFDATCEDVYGRTLAYAWIVEEDGARALLNAEILSEGMARVYEDFDDIRLAPTLYAAQAQAQAQNVGLWSTCE